MTVVWVQFLDGFIEAYQFLEVLDRLVGRDQPLAHRQPTPRVRAVQRVGMHAAACRLGFPHLGGTDAQLACKFLRRRGPSQRLGQVRGRVQELCPDVLDPPRRPDGPTPVTQKTLKFAADGGCGVGREAFAFLLIEAAGGLNEPQVGHLYQV